MLTTIPKFQGHYGIGAVVVLDNHEEVAIVAAKESTLRRVFKKLVFKGGARFDKSLARKCVLVADDLLCQPSAK